jgi:hypothetical protein
LLTLRQHCKPRKLSQMNAPGVEALADAVEDGEGPHHKGEGGGEAEGLVVGGEQEVLFW